MKKALFALAALICSSLMATAQSYLIENFGYANGPLVGAAGSTWSNHSGTVGTLIVTNGSLFINQAGITASREDANRLLSLTFAPDLNANNSDNFLYSSFTVNFSALPNNSTGSYFGHFKSSAANEFYARIGANLTNAAAGTLRVAIANETWPTAAIYPQDLNIGTTYTLVSRHNVDTGESTLWVNPLTELSTSVTALDPRSFSGAINAYALRQGTSGTAPALGEPGDLLIDNLLVGRTFADVVPVPEPGTISLITITAAFFGWRLRRRRS